MINIEKELIQLEKEKQLREIPLIETKSLNKILINEKEYINFASNDYLGISTNNELRQEFLASNESLMSSASARLLSGTSQEFVELEKTLSMLFNKDACLIFNTGYQCNLGVISTLCTKGDVVFSDKLNHASIVDGMRLSNGDFIRYKHLDYEHLEKLLKEKRANYNRAIIISESVFSMDGDLANIDKLVELKNKYKCFLMIDEAHAFGAIGKHFTGLSHGKDVDIITATFGKAIGSFGAFCVSSKPIITYLVNKARSFIYSTSIPPINIAWTNWLLTEKINYLKFQKDKLNKLISNINELLPAEEKLFSQIMPIVIGKNEDTVKLAEILKSKGYYIPAIRPPTVPINTARLRLSLTANININDIKSILKIIHES